MSRSLTALALALLGGVALAAKDTATEPSLTVVGIGNAISRPDMAEIQVGVVSEAKTARKALSTNTAAMDALFKTIAESEIAERDIQTLAFTVAPLYSREDRSSQPSRPPRIVAYRVENQISVKIHHLTRLGEVLDALVTQGANKLHGIRFRVDKPRRLLDEARHAAINDARRKADLYAKAAGVAVGRVLSMQEEMASLPPPQPAFTQAMAAKADVPIAPGESTFAARIVVTYEIIEQ